MSSDRPKRVCAEKSERERKRNDRKTEDDKILKLYNKLTSPTVNKKNIDKRLRIWSGLIKDKLVDLRSKKVECICTSCEKVLNDEFTLDQLNDFISGQYEEDEIPLVVIGSVMSELRYVTVEGNGISLKELKEKLLHWSCAIHAAVLDLTETNYEIVCSCEDGSTFGISDLGIDLYGEFSFIIRSLFEFSSTFDVA